MSQKYFFHRSEIKPPSMLECMNCGYVRKQKEPEDKKCEYCRFRMEIYFYKARKVA